MRLLMTGSHGFVGTNLIEMLSGEHKIIRWDVREDRPLPEVDVVIHLAGKAHDLKQTTDAECYFHVNTELTKKLYDRFLDSTAKKFIFFSSIKALDADTPYAQSKKAAEEYINDIYRKREDVKDGKRTYILRPCMIYGKGMKGNLPLLLKVMKTGLPWPLAAFENQRSYASMDNVSYIVSELLSKNVESGTYSVCDDETISTNELIRIICDCLDKPTRLWRIPRQLMVICAKVGDVFHLPLNSERLGKLTDNYVIDNMPIKQSLGITDMPVRAIDGLKSTIDYLNLNR